MPTSPPNPKRKLNMENNLDISAAIKWIYNRPIEEREDFIVDCFGTSKEYAVELIKSINAFESILINWEADK